MVVFEQGIQIREKWFYSGRSGCILAKKLNSGKVVVFEKKWLYSWKVVLFG